MLASFCQFHYRTLWCVVRAFGFMACKLNTKRGNNKPVFQLAYRHSHQREREREGVGSERASDSVSEEDGGWPNSDNAGSERVDDQGVPARLHKQQKGLRVDSAEDRPLQQLWLQAPLPSCPSPWRRRSSLSFCFSFFVPIQYLCLCHAWLQRKWRKWKQKLKGLGNQNRTYSFLMENVKRIADYVWVKNWLCDQ